MDDILDRDDDTQEPEQKPAQPAFYTVCPFLIDLAYGGPEEGGWYYTHGEPECGPGLPLPVVVRTREEATPLRHQMQQELDSTVNVGRRPVSSVLSSGRYQARICEEWPRAFPEQRPYYE